MMNLIALLALLFMSLTSVETTLDGVSLHDLVKIGPHRFVLITSSSDDKSIASQVWLSTNAGKQWEKTFTTSAFPLRITKGTGPVQAIFSFDSIWISEDSTVHWSFLAHKKREMLVAGTSDTNGLTIVGVDKYGHWYRYRKGGDVTGSVASYPIGLQPREMLVNDRDTFVTFLAHEKYRAALGRRTPDNSTWQYYYFSPEYGPGYLTKDGSRILISAGKRGYAFDTLTSEVQVLSAPLMNVGENLTSQYPDGVFLDELGWMPLPVSRNVKFVRVVTTKDALCVAYQEYSSESKVKVFTMRKPPVRAIQLLAFALGL
jgi:hypothetical protein